MKKIGIATMRGGPNYGNVLQNYAVQTLLEQCGTEAVTLENRTSDGGLPPICKKDSHLRKLRPRYVLSYLELCLRRKFGCKNSRDFTPCGLIRAVKNKSKYLAAKKRRVERFAAVRREALHDDTVQIDAKHIDEAHIATFDAFVCGSDQVWNPNYPQTSMIDFLQFAPEARRIAIAPSFGISALPETRTEIYRKWISSIPHLSVREDAGAKIIKDLTGRDAKVLLDPTFALTKADWLAFAKKPETVPEKPYVFCYFLGKLTGRYCRYIKEYAKKQNCEIVDICDIHDLRYYDTDPREFVWLLANAKAVFTDSFHGTAFSLNLQVPFVVFERVEGGTSMSSRITSVLKKTGMEDRMYGKTDDILDADFTKAAAVIEDERKIIKDYLQQAIEAATK